MEKMSENVRFGYLSGLADMLSYQHVLSGDSDGAKCISDAFFRDKDATWRALFELFGKYPDKPAEGLVVVLMNCACPR